MDCSLRLIGHDERRVSRSSARGPPLPSHPGEARGTEGASIYPPALSKTAAAPSWECQWLHRHLQQETPSPGYLAARAATGATTSTTFNTFSEAITLMITRAWAAHQQQRYGAPQKLAGVADGRNPDASWSKHVPAVGGAFPPAASG